MKKRKNCQNNDEGFILVTALLIMLVLTIIGIAANKNTSIELGIAGNERTFKETFYETDGGTELASEIVEQNVACLEFPDELLMAGDDSGVGSFGVQIVAGSEGFWSNFLEYDNDDAYRAAYLPSDTNRDFYFPADYLITGDSYTNVRVAGSTRLTTGAAIQMAAGYEGRGKGIGTTGATLVYDVNVQRFGKNNSETMLCIQYKHSLGQEGDCYYK